MRIGVQMGGDEVALRAFDREEIEGVAGLLTAGVDGDQVAEQMGPVALALLDEVRLARVSGYA